MNQRSNLERSSAFQTFLSSFVGIRVARAHCIDLHTFFMVFIAFLVVTVITGAMNMDFPFSEVFREVSCPSTAAPSRLPLAWATLRLE